MGWHSPFFFPQGQIRLSSCGRGSMALAKDRGAAEKSL
jgi:hypothetical protein